MYVKALQAVDLEPGLSSRIQEYYDDNLTALYLKAGICSFPDFLSEIYLIPNYFRNNPHIFLSVIRSVFAQVMLYYNLGFFFFDLKPENLLVEGVDQHGCHLIIRDLSQLSMKQQEQIQYTPFYIFDNRTRTSEKNLIFENNEERVQAILHAVGVMGLEMLYISNEMG